LWSTLRDALPPNDKLRSLGFQRLEIWAWLLDPDVAHSRHVAKLALQIFDGLRGVTGSDSERETQRYILHLAAITHDVGRAVGTKGHHKASARLLRRVVPPLGWTAEELQIASLVARYHRGALPRETHKFFATLIKEKQAFLKFLAGILRLACACDQEHDHRIRRVKVENSAPFCSIRAQGYSDASPLAQRIAAARYLLELACSRPVLILPFEAAAISAA
jgi:exopolyphosphatase/guanosine-5'-triphosphate,3'-diphosphate pyrophosphatase